MNIDLCLRRFRLASRELFNGYFQPIADQKSWSDSNILYSSFTELEQALFEKLVSEPAELLPIPYGELQSEIGVEGYEESDYDVAELLKVKPETWDHFMPTFPKGTILSFVRYVDCEPLKCFDNQLVLVQLKSCFVFPELEGRRILTQFCSSRFYRL